MRQGALGWGGLLEGVARGSVAGWPWQVVHRPRPGPSVQGQGEPMGKSVNWGRMSHVVPGSSWLLAQDTSIRPAGAGLAGWAWAE
jgi:hypothetical protein